MIKTLSLILIFSSIFTIKPVEAGIFDWTSTAALMFGQSRERTLSQAEYLLKQPKEVVLYFEGQPDQIEARRYSFNEKYDIILFFGKGEFLALDSIPPDSDSNAYPKLRHNFHSFQKDTPLIGYTILKTGNKMELVVLKRK